MTKITVRVTTVDAELEFMILPFTYGKELFDQAVKAIGLRETWYFGLEFIDKEGCASWLRLNKKILSQDVVKGDYLEFHLRAKFFPENIETEIIQPITLRFFYLQVKEMVLTDALFCPAEMSVLLASYAMQVKYGDYVPETHRPGFLAGKTLVPNRVRDQHKTWSMGEWERKVMLWWNDHRGMQAESAMLEYLKHAEDLEMYGITYFKIANKSGTEVYLGVDSRGLNIYRRDNQLQPEVGFPWSDIRDISFDSKKFRIKMLDKNSESFTFYTDRVKTNKQIMTMCMGNHELYLRRRRPDSVEVKQMKDQAAKDRAIQEAERQRFRDETGAREAAERKQRHAEYELARLNKVVDEKDVELQSANEKIRTLEELGSQSVTGQSVQSDKSMGSVHAGLIIPCELEPEELTRVSIIEQKADVKTKLEALTKELDAVKDMDMLTQHDIVHRAKRRDKYDTLRMIMKGNTQRKVDLFEHM